MSPLSAWNISEFTECGDRLQNRGTYLLGLQTVRGPTGNNDGHFVWEQKKKEYPKSVTELLVLEEKRFVQGVSYFINKIPKFIYKIKKIYKKRKRSQCTNY
jgi:hypothetical protein